MTNNPIKIAYFDCQSGIAGNMVLGALIDAGVPLCYLIKELRKLEIRNWKLEIRKTKRNSISGTLVTVKYKETHKSRNLKDILRIINQANLNKSVKLKSAEIFRRLAEAEAKVHNCPVNHIHFHEVGAVDAIIDIVGSVIALDKLGIDEIYASSIPLGKGTIKHDHGILPIPAPATTELLKGIPVYQTNIKHELVTPTGAAIITSLAKFEDMPKLKVIAQGFGAGHAVLATPNLLRVIIGEAILPTEEDSILQIETNIDDMDPKLYDKAIKKIMRAGALDVYVTPIRMKKERNAVNLIILCKPEDKDKLLETLFSVTPTIGARVYLTKRGKLRIKFKQVKGIKTKFSYLGKELKNVTPEFEEWRRKGR